MTSPIKNQSGTEEQIMDVVMNELLATPKKKKRRSKADIEQIKMALISLLQEEYPMTVRQCFYRMVSIGAIGKSENEYKSTVCRLLSEMRLSGQIPFGWIADNTRWMRKPSTHTNLEAALQRTAQTYRRAVWDNQENYVEIWLEKDALAGVLQDETAPYDVPLMVTRGYPSLSYLFEAAETIAAINKPAHLYYFGDYDPSGVDISRNVEARLRQFAPNADISFNRIAVTEEQIDEFKLPTRPTKRSDSRAKNFKGESVEVDAIPPNTLRAMARNCIESKLDQGELRRLQIIEDGERETLNQIVEMMAA